MISFGVLLVILGVGSLALPYFDPQLTVVDPYQPWAGIIVAALGLITVLFGVERRGRREAAEALAAAAPAAAAPAESAPAADPAFDSRHHNHRLRRRLLRPQDADPRAIRAMLEAPG